MQMLVWTDLRVEGPRPFSEALPQAQFAERIYSRGINPGYQQGTAPLRPVGERFYRDIAVIAFSTPADEPGERAQRKLFLNDHLSLSGPNPGGLIARDKVIDLTSHVQPDGRLVWDVPIGEFWCGNLDQPVSTEMPGSSKLASSAQVPRHFRI